jgi:hypothetical protein
VQNIFRTHTHPQVIDVISLKNNLNEGDIGFTPISDRYFSA